MLQELTSNPLFGLIISIAIFLFAKMLSEKISIPLFNPLIISIIIVIIILKVTNISYDDYYQGGSILNMLIAPATVALAIPLYQSFHLLKHHVRSIMAGIISGVIISIVSTGLFSILFNYNESLMASLLPKSVTTAIAIDISKELGGISTVTIIAVIVTGIGGAIMGPSVLKLVNVDEPVAQGIALGTSAHAIGTSKAFELGKTEGAMSGLAIGVTGIVTVFVAPIMLQLFMKWS